MFSLLTFFAGGFGAPSHEPPPAPPVRTAQLTERIPRLFVDAINKVIRGTIRPARIRYSPPTTLFLEDAVLLDPHGHAVARIEKAEVKIAVTPLLAGNIVIKELRLERPVLDLELEKDGTLNLIEALSPKDASKGDKEGPPDVEIRLDDIRVTGGRFSFVDQEGVRVGARGIEGRANVDVDLKQRSVILNARSLSATAGRFDLKELGVPFTGVSVGRVRVVNDRLEVTNARGKASGADVRAGGTLSWKGDGRLNLSGHIEAPRGAWPERLEPPPFKLPPVSADVTVTGTFKLPTVGAKGSYGSFTAFDYAVDGGTGDVLITQERAQIVSATVRSGPATATARGTVLLTPRTLDLEGRVESLPLRLALSPAKLGDPPKGTVAGSYRMRGSFALEKGPLVVTSTLSARNLMWADVSPPSPLQVTSRVTVTDKRVQIESADVTGRGVTASVNGSVLLKEERVDLQLEAKAESPDGWLKELPERLRVASASFRGAVAGPYDNVVVKGAVEVPQGEAYGVPLRAVTSTMTADNKQVRLSGIKAKAAEGDVSGHVVVRLTTKKRASPALEGQLAVAGAKLARVTLDEKGEVNAQGTVAGRATLSGTTAHPVIEVTATVGDAVLEEEALGDVETRLLVTNTVLRVQQLEVAGPLGTATSDGALTLRFEDMALGGTVVVALTDLSKVKAAEPAQVAGSLEGRVRLDGTVERPDVLAWLEAEQLVVREARLGSGPIFARLHSPSSADGGAVTRVLEASGRLTGPRGLVNVRAAYDLDEKLVNARVRLVEADLLPWLEMAPAALPRAEGLVSGVLHLWGPVDALNGSVRLRVPELVFVDEGDAGEEAEEPAEAAAAADVTLSRADEMRRVKSEGGVILSGELVDGELDALLCAFPSPVDVTVSPCGAGERVWLRASGEVSQREETFALEVRGYIDEDNLQRFVPQLRDIDAELSLVATGLADVSKPSKDAPVEVSGDLSLLAADIQLEDAPSGTLEEPARLRFEKNKVLLEDPVRFLVGDSQVTLAGYAGPGDVRLVVDGTVLLALAKLYSAEVTQASGTAVARLEISVDGGLPKVSGHVAPNQGASLTLRTLRDRMELLGGRVSFRPEAVAAEKTTAERVIVEGLRVSLGDGEASLDGAFTVLLHVDEEDGLEVSGLTRFDLLARGEGIRVRRDRSRVESAFNLRLEQRNGTPFLTGQLEITDGMYRERFELLDNFVLTRPSRPSEPLHQVLAPYGLGDLGLDVDVAVRDFRVRADIVTFPMDASLAGNLRLSNTVRVPALGGALEIVEGSLAFPTARFEIVDSSIEFPRERGSLEPRISLFARAELPPGRTGCETDLPVTLSLKGETTEEVQLDLEAETGDRHTRFDLLMNVLFGQRLAQCEAARGLGDPSNAAVRAFTGQLFASGFTQQIEEAIVDSFGGDIQFNLFLDTGRLGTDVRWQLGRRVVFEGEAPIYTWEAGTGAVVGERENLSASNLRLRFLLFDHVPPGDGELFLETELTTQENELAGTPESNLEGRFKYRLFEY